MTVDATEDTGSRELGILGLNLLEGDLLDKLPAPEPLIDGILFKNTLAALYAPPGYIKSFLAISWGLSVASGSSWMGRQVAKGRVLYVAAEGSFGLRQRRRAWMTAQNVYETDGDYWLTRAVNLLDPKWATAVVQLVKEGGYDFVVVDTLARSMVGGDENSGRDMGTLIAAADAVRLATGACVLLVHHTPKGGDTLRGHSSLEGACDTTIEIRAGGDDRSFVVHCSKQKDAARFADIRVGLRVVGDSCVVDEPEPGPAGLTETGRKVLTALSEIDLGQGVSSSVWKAASDVAERSFYRWQKSLVEADSVGSSGAGNQTRYSLTDQGKEELSGDV